MWKLTNVLILVNLIVFLLVFSMPGVQMQSVFDALSFSGQHSPEVWRWLTSLFMHASASHLFFNMLGLYIFGRVVESETSPGFFLAVFFISGLLGNLAFGLTSAESAVGASGAVFGLLGTAMFLKPAKWTKLYVVPLPLSIVAVLFIITESFVLYFQPAGFANIATVSHIAGILAGTLLAFYHSRRKAAKSIPILAISAIMLILLYPVFGLLTGIGGFILSGIDYVIGIVLYSLASLLSPIW
jgi:membrane associated rhomboid family serine protease